MGRASKPTPNSPSVLEVVEEIMRIYRALPPRPSLEQLEAAMAVIRSADTEEEMRMMEIGKIQRPPDVPEELFLVLQEVRRNQVLLQVQEQRREALCVVELDKRFQLFDELLQRASKLVSSEPEEAGRAAAVGEEKEAEVTVVEGFMAGFDAVAVPRFGRSLSLIKMDKDDKKGELEISKGLLVSTFKPETLLGEILTSIPLLNPIPSL